MLPIPFNNPTTYAGHSGVDYPQKRGTPFRASGPGRVASLGWNPRGGFYIWIQYDAGPLVGYHHMDSHAACPPRHVRVDEGAVIGKVGNSGHSTGPHLHSEVAGKATTYGYWEVFDRNRVVGSSAASAGKPVSKIESELEMHVKLWLYEPTNNLILVDHLNKTMRELGSDPKNVERAEFAKLPYIVIREPDWTKTFKGFRYV